MTLFSHHPLPALLLGASLVLAAPAPALAADAGLTPVVAPKWDPWLELGGFWGSDESSRGEAVLWAPLLQGPDTVLFTDLRGKLFEDDVQEGNFALGWRRMTPSGWNFGAWAGVDVRDTEADNTFWQLSGGLEALSADWDLRVNGYVPLSEPEASPSLAEVKLEGNNIFMVGGEEVPLSGVDGEVGYRVFSTPDTGFGPHHELRLYGGGFWFDADEALEEVAGPKARVEYRIDEVFAGSPGSRLTVEAEYSNDEVRDDRWEVGLRVRIPLWGGPVRTASLSGQERRMAEGLERDTDIVTVQSAAEPVADAATEVAFDRVAYVEGGGSITNTSSAAGDNTLIIANGTVNGAQQLQGKQTLQGGGSTIAVRGQNSGTVAPFTAPGSRPTLAAPGNADNLTLLGSDTHVAGLDIVGSGGVNFSNEGISGGSGLSNLLIEQTSIADTGGTGILFFDNTSDVTITGTSIANAGSVGISFHGGNRNITIADTTIANAGADGILFVDGNRNVTIAGTTINNPDGDGIDFGSDNGNVRIAGATIVNADNSGIRFSDRNDNVAITSTTITSPSSSQSGFGVFFNDRNTDVTIADTSISDTTLDGILFDSFNIGVAIAGSTITNAGDDGIDFGSENGNVRIAGATITNAADNGIRLSNDNSNVTIADTTITAPGENGVFFNVGNTDFTIANTSIVGALNNGVFFDSDNTVTIADTTITNAGSDGVDVGGDDNNVTITGTTITDAFFNGLNLTSQNNTVTLAGSTITDAGGNGINFIGSTSSLTITGTTITSTSVADTNDAIFMSGTGNTVTLENSTLAGTFGGDGIDISGTPNTLAGGGNTAAGAVFNGQFCNVPGAQNGFFTFVDDGTGNPATCP